MSSRIRHAAQRRKAHLAAPPALRPAATSFPPRQAPPAPPARRLLLPSRQPHLLALLLPAATSALASQAATSGERRASPHAPDSVAGLLPAAEVERTTSISRPRPRCLLRRCNTAPPYSSRFGAALRPAIAACPCSRRPARPARRQLALGWGARKDGDDSAGRRCSSRSPPVPSSRAAPTGEPRQRAPTPRDP